MFCEVCLLRSFRKATLSMLYGQPILECVGVFSNKKKGSLSASMRGKLSWMGQQFKVVLHGSPRSPDIHNLSECHYLYDLGWHTSLTVLTLTPKNYPWDLWRNTLINKEPLELWHIQPSDPVASESVALMNEQLNDLFDRVYFICGVFTTREVEICCQRLQINVYFH